MDNINKHQVRKIDACSEPTRSSLFERYLNQTLTTEEIRKENLLRKSREEY